MNKMDKYCKLLLTIGADDAKLIEVSTIITEPWAMYKCQSGNGRYGKNLCCPPFSVSLGSAKK
jgi:predicted metal-binding protein